MKFNAKHMVSILGLMGCFGTGFAGQYQGSAINRIYNQINNEYINLSSREVAAQEKPILSRKFGEGLLENKIMQKVQKINREGSTETTLEVTVLEEAIAKGFAQKEQDLQIALSQCRPKQILCGTVVGLGLAIAGFSIASSGGRRGSEKTILQVIAGVSALGAVGGGVGLYSLSGEKNRIENHIAQVHIMQGQWDKFFK